MLVSLWFLAVLAPADAVRPANEVLRGDARPAQHASDVPGSGSSLTEKTEIKSIARFWLLLGTLGLTGYGISIVSKINERGEVTRGFDVNRVLKLVAVRLHKDKIFMQVSCTAVLFALADVLAQLVPSYHEKSNLEDGYKLGRWDWRYTMAVVISALLFQVIILGRFYDHCDARFGSGVSWQSVSLKMLKMQGAFTLIYLPLAVFFFALSMCLVFRGLGDGTENCAMSALAASPGNLGSSLMMAAQLWPGDYLHSVAFWPPSHLISYVLIQRWLPNFRPIFDGVVVFSWNIYVLAGGAQREAVGPTLFGAAPGANGKIPPSVDCSKYSLDGFRSWCWAKMGELWVQSKEGLVALWRNTCWATVNSWKWLKHGCNWLRQHTLAGVVFFLSTLRWLIVMVLYCLGFVLLWILTALRVGGYWVLAILKGALMIILSIVDFIKKCMVVWFWLPDSSSLGNGCFYCVLWPKDGQWPKQILGPMPKFNEYVDPFCPHCY